MSKTRKVFIIILSILIALTLGFIWGNSILSKNSSAQGSSRVMQFIKPIFDAIFGEEFLTHALFRKLAHTAEFFILAVEVNLLFLAIFKVKWINLLWSFIACVIVASIDETIQIFSNRGASVVDVLIDSIGIALALLVFVVVTLIVKLKKHKQKE